MGQTATFDVIGVVGQVNLCSVVNASSELGGFLLPQRRQQWRLFLLGFPTLRQDGISRDVPRLTSDESAFNLSCGTIVAGGALCDAELLGKLCD